MTNEPLSRIQALLEAFVAGPNRSLQAAREIEGAIADSLPPDHTLQELAEDFAQYRPGGGEGLYSEVQLLPKVAGSLRRGKQSGYFV
jgi:hypothetical protein